MDKYIKVIYRGFFHGLIREIKQYRVGNTVMLNLTCEINGKLRYYQYQITPDKVTRSPIAKSITIYKEPCTSAGRYGGLPIKARRV